MMHNKLMYGFPTADLCSNERGKTMNLLSRVIRGKIDKPFLVLIHGAPGVGKSTFAADAPNAIFLGTEDGTSSLDVARLPEITSLKAARTALHALLTESHDFQTLVIDSLDWLEPMVFAEVCEEAGATSIEEAHGGWGKGYVAALAKWREVIELVSRVRNEKGMNVVLIAHSQVKKFDDLKENKTFDRWTLKLNEKASALWQEFVDTVLFATYQVATKKDEQNKVRAYSDGSRVMFTGWRPGFVAKNRYNLPQELALSWDAFAEAAKAGKPADPATLKTEISALLQLVDDKTKTTVLSHLAKLGNDATGLAKTLNRLQTIANQRN